MIKKRFQLRQSGMGMIEVLFVLGVASVVVVSVLNFSSFLRSQKVQSNELAALDSVALTIARLLNNNTAWKFTKDNNATMGCLKDGRGRDCTGGRVAFYSVRDTTNNIYYNSGGSNGLTQNGLGCMNYPSLDCPYRFELEFVALTQNEVPWVGILVTLKVGKNPINNTPFRDLIFNPIEHGFTLPAGTPINMSSAGIIKRLALYP